MNFRSVSLVATLLLCMTAFPSAAESPLAEARKGVELHKKKDLEGAIKSFGRAAELKPSPEEMAAIQYDLGTALAEKGDAAEAEAALGRALTYDGLPSRSDAFFNLGLSRIEGALKEGQGSKEPQKQLQGLRSGLEAFRDAVITNPFDREARHNFEVTQEMIRRLEEQMKQNQQSKENQKKQDKDKKDDKKQGDDKNPDKKPSDDKKDDPQKQQDDPKSKEQEGKEDQQKSQDEQQQSQDKNEKGSEDKKEKDGGDGSPQDQGKDQRNDKQKDPSDEQKGKDTQSQSGEKAGATPAPKPQPKAGEKEGDPKGGQKPQPPGQPQGKRGDAGEPNEQEPPKELTPEQVDALRVLNSLEKETPDQFKKLFKFRVPAGAKRRERDW